MGQITRSRRAQIQREAAIIRMREQRNGVSLERIVTVMRSTLPELSPLEAWRLALGWSRAQTVAQVADLYLADGLKPPALSEPMLCRWEHGPDRPGPEYTEMIARAYGARVDQLGVRPRCVCGADLGGYGQQTAPLIVPGVEMTAAGLPAVRESLRLALLDAPYGGPVVVELAEAAVEHYALHYSRHVPAHLFDEVHAARSLLGEALAAPVNATIGAELRRAAGWLSALLGNLAFHLADHAGARAHLAVAASFGEHVGDARLTTWAYGAQSMVARARGDLPTALRHAEASAAHAVGQLGHAQALGWALLPTLARLGRAADAEQALTEATTALDADPAGGAPGRFGFDVAELALHEAEAWLALGHSDRALVRASASAASCVAYTPGWAAATLVVAQAEVGVQPGDAAARALDVLERVPAERLRSTARSRLGVLTVALGGADAASARDLRERVRDLPPVAR
ncbi:MULTISPECIES: helix-turn-helix domain-containing protein [Streptosporangium]|uniref:Transcriptional regulator with XRE-family HTH domain n=1 Tax=Streptosporangium brasiliense TaxID=47480 RepID=A0ABT9RLS6_9ACTN|nr:helix-turn-helix transcriptional regulator [Streptosporangium brasiliense]MDP9870222.1 transcriptional regulator with XRE-family HTH domain [Streptosporangium brasiliense]